MEKSSPLKPLRFTDGPSIYGWVAIMFLAIITVTMALFSHSPTANPSLQLQGGETLEKAETRLVFVSAIVAALAGLMILPLARWRTTTIDLVAREIRVATLGVPPGRSVVRFADVARAEARRRDRDDYVLHDLVVTPRQGRRIVVGTSPVDWGIDAAAETIRAHGR